MGKRDALTDHYRYGLTDHQMRQLTPVLDEMDRNARAYGWEVGRGKPLTAVLDFDPDNPFLNPDWRDNVDDRTYDLIGDDGTVVRTIRVPADAGEATQDTETPSDGGHFELIERQDPLRWGGSGEVPHSSRLLPYEGGPK